MAQDSTLQLVELQDKLAQQQKIQENLVSAIEILFQAFIKKTPLDVTTEVEIVKIVDASTGTYRVRYDEACLTAYSIGNAIYNLHDYVYMLIPGNNIENRKFIIGKTSGESGVITNDIELTQAEYDALSYDEQHNGKNYFITDGE